MVEKVNKEFIHELARKAFGAYVGLWNLRINNRAFDARELQYFIELERTIKSIIKLTRKDKNEYIISRDHCKEKSI